MKCPACRQPLVVVERDNIEVDWCANCHGVWFDVGELDVLAAKAGKQLRPDTIGQAVRGQREKGRRCPRCRRKMTKASPAGNPDLLLDRCREHGLWFDAGELASLLRGLSPTGSDANAVVEFLNETFTRNQESAP